MFCLYRDNAAATATVKVDCMIIVFATSSVCSRQNSVLFARPRGPGTSLLEKGQLHLPIRPGDGAITPSDKVGLD